MTLKAIFLLITISLFGKEPSIAQNIEILGFGNPNEPSIMMDPNNTNHLVAGANHNFFFSSNDGGLTWASNTLNSTYGVWGDPVIDVDTSGNFYFFHLSNPNTGSFIDRIVCQKSTDNGTNWSNGTFTGLNGNKVQDKQWSVVDRTNNNIYLTWTQFDNYHSSNPSDSSIILFSKSINSGNTWSPPKRINKYAGNCLDDDNTVEGAVPAVGPNGEIYVAWAGPNGIVFNKSLDQGDSWLTQEITISTMPGGWTFDIPGLSRANGLPITKCDLSGGPNHGTIYVNWSDQRNGTDNTDIWLAKSTDGGLTWSLPTKVNDDVTNRQQFLTWMDIDQTNGNLFFVFYDRRAHSDNKTDVYMAISKDGGDTFINKKISETPFLPYETIFFGDYTNITAHNNIVRPIWTRFDVNLSIWTNITPLDEILSIKNDIIDLSEINQYPIPSSNIVYVSFKLHHSSDISLEIYNQKGELVNTQLKNKIMSYGKHVVAINLSDLKLHSGTYYNKLTINGQTKILKNIIIN